MGVDVSAKCRISRSVAMCWLWISCIDIVWDNGENTLKVNA